MKRRLDGVSDELLQIVAENDLDEFEDFGTVQKGDNNNDDDNGGDGDVDDDLAEAMNDVLGKASRGDRPGLA